MRACTLKFKTCLRLQMKRINQDKTDAAASAISAVARRTLLISKVSLSAFIYRTVLQVLYAYKIKDFILVILKKQLCHHLDLISTSIYSTDRLSCLMLEHKLEYIHFPTQNTSHTSYKYVFAST